MKSVDFSTFCRGGGNSKLTLFSAFTLAEVLITLGIIGVVAALTMPSLIANYRKSVYVNQLKKTTNSLSNGLRLIMVQEDVDKLEDTKLSHFFSEANYATKPSDDLHTYISKYFNSVESSFIPSCSMGQYKNLNGTTSCKPSGNGLSIKLADGAEIVFVSYGHTSNSTIIMDVNGRERGPNTAGLDLFGTLIMNDAVVKASGSTTLCHSQYTDPSSCFARVVQDNWEITYY